MLSSNRIHKNRLRAYSHQEKAVVKAKKIKEQTTNMVDIFSFRFRIRSV